MTKLSAKKESFIKMMSESEEYARHGFDLLSKREQPEDYFDALAEAGFFDPDKNPGPRPSTEPGFVQIPFWSALTYLEAVARRSGDTDDLALANKVLDVVRNVSRTREPDGTIRDNYSTFWKFALILGLVPTAAVTMDDIDLIPSWLTSKYNKSMVGHVLGKSVIGRFLASNNHEDVEKACRILLHCTTFDWIDGSTAGGDVATRVDDYWLRAMVGEHAAPFGQKAGKAASDIFADRLRQLFGDERRPYGSTMWRAAIESSPQNYDFRAAENAFVEGLRDVLLSWLDSEPDAARAYVALALRDKQEIVRRIAVHCVTERFDILHETLSEILKPDFFSLGHRHELYRLLQERFGQFSDTEKAATIDSIRHIAPPKTGDDPAIRLRRIQREWLTALKGAGYEPAETWRSELDADNALGPPSDHPDYLTYHETRVGPGPAPFGEETILASAEDGSLVDRLHQFKEGDDWKGPTLGGLVDALQTTVAQHPDVFIYVLEQFLLAKRPFQHALVAGFKRALDSRKENPTFDWTAAWPKLLTFFSSLVSAESFWTEEVPEKDVMIPDRKWIASAIADFLQAGTKDDTTAYPPELLPEGLEIIKILLKRSASADRPSFDDPMIQALNTGKGRAIDALVNHALRVCRLSAKANGTTSTGWAQVQDVFAEELEKCRDANFEFSTLMSAYIGNLQYMDSAWLAANASKIYPKNYEANFLCALGGLPYAHVSQPLYRLLEPLGVFERALAAKVKDSRAQERIVEWIGLAYLWGDENLGSPKLQSLFDEGRFDDIDSIVELFWQVRGEPLTAEQRVRIFDLWGKIVEWIKDAGSKPVALLGHLARLACYVSEIDERTKPLLLAVAPYVNRTYDSEMLVTELARLVDKYPADVADILQRTLEASLPDYDLDDKLKKLIRRLYELGLKEQARACAERLRGSLPGMLDLYKELMGGP
jgi:hypothetical protein